MERRIGLDLARAAAITLVLAAHFVKKIDVLGFYGVELFFALSGFLIGGILVRTLEVPGEWSLSRVWNFWARRWWRTLPNYYLFFFVFLLFHSLQGGLPSWGKILLHPVFLQNVTGTQAFYGISWSLCVEEWFYLLFPLVLLMATKCGLSKKSAFFTTVVLFCALPTVGRELLNSTAKDLNLRALTFVRLDAICYGVLAGVIVKQFGFLDLRRLILFLCGFLCLVVSIFFEIIIAKRLHVDLHRIALVVVPVSFALMLPFLESWTLRGELRFLVKPITAMSLWSYSIYLCHLPVLFTTYFLFGGTRDTVFGNIISKIVGLLLTLVISRILFIKWESPLTARRPAEITNYRMGDGQVSVSVDELHAMR